MLNRKFYIFVALACTACSSDEERGLSELKRLCNKDSGLTIVRSVNAQGYYIANKNKWVVDKDSSNSIKNKFKRISREVQ